MTFRSFLVNTAIAIVISVPIIIAKIKVGNTPNLYEGPKDIEIETLPIETVEAHPIEPETTTVAFVPCEDIPLPDEMQTYIYNKCKRYGIPYDLALAVIKTESEFQIDAVGDDGAAIGLCQIWPYWWGALADEKNLNIYEPTDNVELMLIILRDNLDYCNGNVTMALQMYNTGLPDGEEYANRVYDNQAQLLEVI